MRHEEIQRIYKNHYYTAFRNMGSVKRLVGKVDVIVFFVNDSQSTWNDRAKQQYRTTQKEAMQYIQRTAHSRGIHLQIRNAYLDTTVSMPCSRVNYVDWVKAIMAKYGSPDMFTFQQRFKNAHHCDEAPILFVFNKPFRSSAFPTDWESRLWGEMAIISAPSQARTVVHELLHQFGAADLYYPSEVHNLVQKLNYASIMAYSTSLHIDSLTSYLIGWTNEIDHSAALILERTKHFTRDSMIEAIKREHQRR